MRNSLFSPSNASSEAAVCVASPLLISSPISLSGNGGWKAQKGVARDLDAKSWPFLGSPATPACIGEFAEKSTVCSSSVCAAACAVAPLASDTRPVDVEAVMDFANYDAAPGICFDCGYVGEAEGCTFGRSTCAAAHCPSCRSGTECECGDVSSEDVTIETTGVMVTDVRTCFAFDVDRAYRQGASADDHFVYVHPPPGLRSDADDCPRDNDPVLGPCRTDGCLGHREPDCTNVGNGVFPYPWWGATCFSWLCTTCGDGYECWCGTVTYLRLSQSLASCSVRC